MAAAGALGAASLKDPHSHDKPASPPGEAPGLDAAAGADRSSSWVERRTTAGRSGGSKPRAARDSGLARRLSPPPAGGLAGAKRSAPGRPAPSTNSNSGAPPAVGTTQRQPPRGYRHRAARGCWPIWPDQRWPQLNSLLHSLAGKEIAGRSGPGAQEPGPGPTTSGSSRSAPDPPPAATPGKPERGPWAGV